MFDNMIVVYRNSCDVWFYVVGNQTENELILVNALMALYDALSNQQIAGAGLDVMVDAEPSPDTPLFKLDNLLVTPHVAFFSQEATLELEQRAAREVAYVLTGRMPDNLVNPVVLEHANPRHNLRKD